jgi:hypothetical protein
VKDNDSKIISSPENPVKKNEKVLIDDDMMIFCVLTTAATIIQKKFREYRAKKIN